ncbi:MAG: ketoacyl-ACP synthase III [Spirochaetales bacterium]|nr:ketoacyl-ACP synthase III [Spirochaetales bacterium]
MTPRVLSTGMAVPLRRMSNHDLAQTLDTSDEWIYSHTGIRYRYIAAEGENTSDLAVRACQQALTRSGKTADDVDLILLATGSPDYPGFPSSASLVQDKLGCQYAGAMDLVAACSGFVYALETARSFLISGAAHLVLVVGAEVFSRIVDWSDRSTCVLFGDGAGAVLVGMDDQLPTDSFRPSLLSSDGSGALALTSRTAISPFVHMEGRRVYNFAVQVMKDLIPSILEKNFLTVNDIQWIVPHQANFRIIEATAKRLDIPIEKFYTNIEEYANTSGASIPLALAEMDHKGLLVRGAWVLTIGFGAGLTAGANLFRW